MSGPDEIVSYKPSAFYWRDALRNSKSWAEAVEIGMQLVMELEHQKEFIRSFDLIPPKVFVPAAEAREKGWEAQTEFVFTQVHEPPSALPQSFQTDV
jgi:hypothetical protein